MDPIKVKAADFQRNIGHYQDLALRQPIAVTRNGRESCMFISVEEYRRLKRRAREVLAIEELAEADAAAVAHAHPPVETAAFDDELTS